MEPSIILSIAMLAINIILGLLGWSLKEKLQTLVTKEECQRIRSACADARSGSTAGIIRVESELKNLAQRQESMDRKIDNILNKFERLPLEYVTLERLRDMTQDRG